MVLADALLLAVAMTTCTYPNLVSVPFMCHWASLLCNTNRSLWLYSRVQSRTKLMSSLIRQC